MRNRIPSLDGIRAISISLVIFDHVAERSTHWSSYGGFGVDIFFVLSGFIITYLLCAEEEQHGAISLASFYLRRALRILPPALLCIAVTSVLASIGWANVAPNEPLYAALFVRNFMAHGGLQLGHFWTLAIEEQFYLIWPLLFLWLGSNRKRLAFTLALFLAAPFWQHEAYKLAGGGAYVNQMRFDLRYQPIVAGCCLALFRRHAGNAFKSGFAVSPFAGFLALIVTVAGVAGFPHRAFSATVADLGVVAFINYVIERPEGPFVRILNLRAIVFLGQLSYSLYLWQQMFCRSSEIPFWGSFPQNVIASLVVALLSFNFVEKPLSKFRRLIPYIPNVALGAKRSTAALALK